MKAIFHSLKSKTALILVADKFTVGFIPVYVPPSAVEGLEPGDELTIPEGYKIEDWQQVKTSTGADVMLKRLVRK